MVDASLGNARLRCAREPAPAFGDDSCTKCLCRFKGTVGKALKRRRKQLIAKALTKSRPDRSHGVQVAATPLIKRCQKHAFSSGLVICHSAGRVRSEERKQYDMNFLRIAALFVLAMLTIMTSVQSADAQNTVGTITQIQGVANIQRGGATIAAAQNMAIMLHDKIVTEANASLTVGLVDNSSLQLGASSTLTIDESMLVNGVGAPSKVRLLDGDLRTLIVGAMKGSTTTFEVHTPNAIGAVRGTGWLTRYSNSPEPAYANCLQFTTVDVSEGTVHVCNDEKQCKKRECQDLTAGTHIKVACCGFFEASTSSGGGLSTAGTVGLGVAGVGVAAGAGVGIAAGAGAFGSSGSSGPVSAAK